MKKFILLVLLVAIIFVVMSKHRLYVRDPLANVTRNGAKEAGAQVYLNFDNDILIENDSAPGGMELELVQHNRPVGTPAALHGVHWLLYLADADQPTLVQEHEGAQITSMDAKTITFTDSGKRETVVTLR